MSRRHLPRLLEGSDAALDVALIEVAVLAARIREHGDDVECLTAAGCARANRQGTDDLPNLAQARTRALVSLFGPPNTRP
jgi:hypothetical protein